MADQTKPKSIWDWPIGPMSAPDTQSYFHTGETPPPNPWADNLFSTMVSPYVTAGKNAWDLYNQGLDWMYRPGGMRTLLAAPATGVNAAKNVWGNWDPNKGTFGNIMNPYFTGLDAAIGAVEHSLGLGGPSADAGPAPDAGGGYPHPAPGPETAPAPDGGLDITSLLEQGPTTTSQTYTSTPIDYTSGYPNSPQEAPIDWSQINQTFDQSRPTAPTIDKGNALMAFLGAAARASAGAGSFAQALAAAGGGGLLGLLDQRQQEQLMQTEYQKADQQWQASKAQLMSAQTSADRAVAQRNMQASWQDKLQLYKLDLQNQEQKQTDVQASGNTVQVKQYNPNTGQMEYTIHQYHDGPSMFEKIQLLKALSDKGGGGKLSFGDWGDLAGSDVPPQLRGVYTASTLIGAGAFPVQQLGQKGQVLQNMINEFWQNNDSTDKSAYDRLRAQITALLMSPEGQPMLKEIYQYMGQ